MKKLLSLIAVIAFVGAVVLTGCKKADETAPAPPDAAPTNAPTPAP